MTADINDTLSPEPIPVFDLDNLPPEGFDLPQPGSAIFTLPSKFLWNKLATPNGERVEFHFKKADGVDARLHYSREGEAGTLTLRLSNREFGKRPPKLTYLLAALKFKGSPGTNQEVVDALESQSGEKFLANIVWNAKNRNTGDRFSSRPYTPKEGPAVLPIPKDNRGKFLQEFDNNGTLVRCFPDLEVFRPAQ